MPQHLPDRDDVADGLIADAIWDAGQLHARPNEDLAAFVGVFTFTGYNDAGAEYTRMRRISSAGATCGEVRQMLLEALDMLAAAPTSN